MTAFPDSYDEARAQFLDAAAAAGAEMECHRLPTEPDTEGALLAIDVAVLGAPDAARTLFLLSGTHGIEGYVGSIVQTRLLRRLRDDRLPPDTRLVLVHGVNPHGFARATRGNESNVDLNRNHLTPGEPVPANPGYPAIHQIVAVGDWGPGTAEAIAAGLADYAAAHGAQALTDALIGGQYVVPDGLNYGGVRREWSLRVVDDIVRRLGRDGGWRIVVDLHAGIAPRGDAAILCFGTPEDPLTAVEAGYFAAPADDRFHFGAPGLAAFTGLLVTGLKREQGPRTIGAVVEFGTTTRAAIRIALCRDLWLRFHAPADPAAVAEARDAIREVFYPAAPAWRARLAELGDVLCAGLLDPARLEALPR